MRYLAFVSYAHRDSSQARWLHRAIETYRLPSRVSSARALPRRPGRLFLDRSELSSSPDLSASIEAALADAEHLIVVCSPAAAASHWVNEEVRRFRAMRGRDRIFCLIVDGDPALRDGPGGCFPPALLAPQPGDERPGEPLAADIRSGQDRRGDARLKLIAGLLGVEFDALRQREQARRLRRLAFVTAGFALLAAVLTALSVYALVSRNEARRQTETARQTVEFLRRLITSVNPVEARGHQPTVKEMVDRGAAQIDTAQELRGQPLVRADMMTDLAGVYAALGEYRAAERLVRRASLVDRSDPLVVRRQDKIRAEIANAEGRFAEARALTDQALGVAGTSPSPIRTLILLDRAFAESGLGDDAAAKRTLVQARAESLAQRPPDLDGADRALKEIATGLLEQGRYPEAQRGFEELLRSRRRLGVGDDPVVGFAYNELGTIRYKLGDNPAARHWFAAALASGTRLVGADHPEVATIKGNLARIMVEQRELAPALRLLGEARAALVRELGAGAAVFASQDDSIGLARQALGDAAGAEQAYRRGLAVADRTHAGKQADLLIDLSSLLCETGRARQALPLLADAARRYATAVSTPEGMLARADQVRGRCLYLAGDRDGGAALVRRGGPRVIRRWGAASLFGMEAQDALSEVNP